jgi:hypothetical protein
MKIIPGSSRHHYLIRVSVFIVIAVLIAGMAGCDGDGGNLPTSENLEIRTWYDLDAIRDNLAGNHTLMNNLDSATPGYQELASPTANGGKGWEPIGFYTPQGDTAYVGFRGTFDGQGYEIRDLYINRPDEVAIGLFRELASGGVISYTGAASVAVTGGTLGVGGLVAVNDGTISNCYCTGHVTGDEYVGGLVGLTIVDGTVENSYFTGNVSGNLQVGGLAGRNTGTVRNSYSTGSVTGTTGVGGLVGYGGVGIVTNSFWDRETSGQPSSDGGTGKTTAEMQDITTFLGASWNITAVALNETNPAYTWNIVNNVTYPFLGWQS